MRKPGIGAIVIILLATACAGGGGQWTLPTPPPSPIEVSPLPPFDPQEDRVVQVVERVRPAVVNVRTTFAISPEEEALGADNEAEGTGFYVDPRGVVVTNFHVVESPTGMGVTAIDVILEDGRRLSASLIGGDPQADLAVLQVEGDGPFPAVPLGSSGGLRLGEPVVAVGFALGLEGGPSVTTGVISALGRTIEAGGQGIESRTYEGVIQTDAAINPGNSGGPLVDLEGRVVGVNTAGVPATTAENIGFAIAIDRARPVIEDAIEEPATLQAYLGVTTTPVTPAVQAQLDLPVDAGAIVTSLAPGAPAEEAGIEVGDVIVSIAGQAVDSPETVGEALRQHSPEDRVQISLVRADGDQEVIDVTLAARPLPVEVEQG
jgi:S1-C subfamily serine protease